MKTIGDLRHANKFCVETPDKGILWVPNYDIAKQYASDPKNKDWYMKTIIASYEQVIQADDGRFYFKSQAPKKTVEQTFIDNLFLFKQQSKRKIEKELKKYANDKGFDSFFELISFYNSTIKSYKNLAKEALKYRDTIYSYTDQFFTKVQENKSKDISGIYDEYLRNFPFIN